MAKKKKKRGGKLVVSTPRGGFIPASRASQIRRIASEASRFYDSLPPYAKQVVNYTYAKARDKGLEAAREAMKKTGIPDAYKVAGDVIGKIAGAGQDAIGGSTGDVPFFESESVKRRVAGNTDVSLKRHITKFESGKPSSKVMRQLARLNGSTDVTIFDSRYNVSTGVNLGRPLLHTTCGFNAKRLSHLAQLDWSASAMATAFDMASWYTPSNKLQTVYGQVMHLWRKVTFMNTGQHFPCYVKIRLYRLEEDFGLDQVFINSALGATEVANGTQGARRMPLKYQLTGYNYDSQGPLTRRSFQCTKEAKLQDAPFAQGTVTQVKSFTKKLNPGDVWDWREEMQCGSGLNLAALDTLQASSTSLGYGLIYEVYGVPCEAVDAGNFTNRILGTSPASVQMEFSYGFKAVNASLNQTNFLSDAATGGLTSSRWALRQFTKRGPGDNINKIIWYNTDKILDKSDKKAGYIFIPVMTDSVRSFASDMITDQEDAL